METAAFILMGGIVVLLSIWMVTRFKKDTHLTTSTTLDSEHQKEIEISYHNHWTTRWKFAAIVLGVSTAIGVGVGFCAYLTDMYPYEKRAEYLHCKEYADKYEDFYDAYNECWEDKEECKNEEKREEGLRETCEMERMNLKAQASTCEEAPQIEDELERCKKALSIFSGDGALMIP